MIFFCFLGFILPRIFRIVFEVLVPISWIWFLSAAQYYVSVETCKTANHRAIMQIDVIETLCLDIPETVLKNLPNFSISGPLDFDIKVDSKEHAYGKGILPQSFVISCSKNWHERNLKKRSARLCMPILHIYSENSLNSSLLEVGPREAAKKATFHLLEVLALIQNTTN